MQLRKQRPIYWVVLSCLSACLYDRDDRCGEHQKLDEGTCVCVEGYVLAGTTCEETAAPPDAGSGAEDDGGGPISEDGGRGPITGQNEPCTAHASCAGYDATYCNPIIGKCQVQGCTDTSCDPEYMCIDLGMYIPGEPKVCLNPADFGR
jgi:hypothetical protein